MVLLVYLGAADGEDELDEALADVLVGAGLGLGPERADGIVKAQLGGGDVDAEVDLADLALAVVGGEEVLRDVQLQLLFLQLRIVLCHR